jgi:hypothetical protein
MAVIAGASKDAFYFRRRGEITADGRIRQYDRRKLCGDHLRGDKHQSGCEQQFCGVSKQQRRGSS